MSQQRTIEELLKIAEPVPSEGPPAYVIYVVYGLISYILTNVLMTQEYHPDLDCLFYYEHVLIALVLAGYASYLSNDFKSMKIIHFATGILVTSLIFSPIYIGTENMKKILMPLEFFHLFFLAVLVNLHNYEEVGLIEEESEESEDGNQDIWKSRLETILGVTTILEITVFGRELLLNIENSFFLYYGLLMIPMILGITWILTRSDDKFRTLTFLVSYFAFFIVIGIDMLERCPEKALERMILLIPVNHFVAWIIVIAIHGWGDEKPKVSTATELQIL